MLPGSKLLLSLAALASLGRVACNEPAQVPLSNSCVDKCDALGCNANGGATPTVNEGTTIIPQVPAGPSPWSPPPEFPGATEAGSSVGPDGKTTVSWKITRPTTIAIPNSAPTDPPCASWVVTTVKKTLTAGGQTIIFEEPGLTAVGPPPITSWSTSTTTSYSTTTETSVSTTTSILPPVTTTEVSVSVSTTTTTSVPPPVFVTETSTSTTTTTSIPPPVTSTTTETSVSVSTTTSIPPPVTEVSTSISYVTLPPVTLPPVTLPPVTTTETSTSISVWVSTTTSVPPPVTSWAYSTTTEISWSTLTSWSTYTVPPSTSTTTTTVTTTSSYCPPTQPPTPPQAPCVPGIVTGWTAVDVYKGRPFSLSWSDPYPAVLKIQDAGYKTEKYAVSVDGGQIGTTPDVSTDRATWCGLQTSALQTCKAQGLAYGEFTIPSGAHAVAVTNIPGVYDDRIASYSTLFYQLERKCANAYVPPAPACSPDIQQGWTAADVYEGRNYNLNTFNYPYPVKLTLVDGGYLAEKFWVIVDNVQIGQTRDYSTNLNVWCGITADAAQACLNQGFSSGVFIVPAGQHSVAFSSTSTRNPAWAAYSTMFWKVEKYCP